MRTLSGEELTGAAPLDEGVQHFVECTFSGLDLQRRSLRGLTFDHCRWDRCNLRLADVTNARFVRSRFTSCDVMGLDWTRTRWDSSVLHPPVAFAHSKLDYGSFRGLSLRSATFYACSAREVDFGAADLSEADLRHSELTGASFHHADLRGADLVGAQGYVLDLASTRLDGCRVAYPAAQALLDQLGLRVEDVPGDPLSAERVFPEDD